MKKISDKNYEEYKKLKEWKEFVDVRESMKSVKTLEEDIDFPIRRLVALIALLGIKPLFSCCGFDYDGQSYHKSHQYGEPYVMMKYSEEVQLLAGVMSKIPNEWHLRKQNNVAVLLELKISRNPHWNNKKSIHFSEEMASLIYYAEEVISAYLSTFMKDEVTITDGNELNKKNNKYWQYEPKGTWTIYKKDWIRDEEK